MPRKLLFVCLGNICRSPTAEAVFRAKAGAADLDLSLDSAGTGNWHVGDPPYGPMQAAALARGYDMSNLRARQLAADDFGRFDLILAMDRKNLADIGHVAPTGTTAAQISLFLEVLPDSGRDVPDPYYTGDFEGALALIESATDAWLDRLRVESST